MFKRFFLFFGVNILIMITISTVMQLLGIGHYLSANGINYSSLMIFCLMWGMGGAFISLQLSKWMAKSLYGVQIQTPTGPYGEIVRAVHEFSRKAGIKTMPEVGIYESPDLNAFATGPSKNNSLVAVSTGLLQKMSKDEVDGVLAHEVSHIANGDMVTMTLLQGVMNAFVMFFARIAAYAVSQVMRGDDEEGGGLSYFAHIAIVILFEILFGILASIVVSYFSRFREFRADAGGGALAGKDKMVGALRALQRNFELTENVKAPQSMAAMQISSKSSLMKLFSTHPDLQDRIEALENRIR